MGKLIDLTGKRFGKFTVLRRTENDRHGKPKWLCKCDCGSEKSVIGNNLKNGTSQSCGCNENARGMSKTPEYVAWTGILRRCQNKKSRAWAYYGGRGIEVRFASFSEFLEYLGPRPTPSHSVDRIDNGGHYEPGNVRWADKSTQARNTRRTRYIAHGGEVKTLGDWAEHIGIDHATLQYRLKSWGTERALTTPKRW